MEEHLAKKVEKTELVHEEVNNGNVESNLDIRKSADPAKIKKNTVDESKLDVGDVSEGVSKANKYSLSGEEHYESLKDLFGANNVKWETKASKYDDAVFADDEKLVSHIVMNLEHIHLMII